MHSGRLSIVPVKSWFIRSRMLLLPSSGRATFVAVFDNLPSVLSKMERAVPRGDDRTFADAALFGLLLLLGCIPYQTLGD